MFKNKKKKKYKLEGNILKNINSGNILQNIALNNISKILKIIKKINLLKSQTKFSVNNLKIN